MSDPAFVEFLVNSFKREGFDLKEHNLFAFEVMRGHHAGMLSELENIEEGNFVLELMIAYLCLTTQVLRSKGFDDKTIKDNFVLFFQSDNFVFGETKASFATGFFDGLAESIF